MIQIISARCDGWKARSLQIVEDGKTRHLRVTGHRLDIATASDGTPYKINMGDFNGLAPNLVSVSRVYQEERS